MLPAVFIAGRPKDHALPKVSSAVTIQVRRPSRS